MYKVVLSDGKYTVLMSEGKEPFKFEALRHGEKWRDLTGDNLVMALVYKIQELEEAQQPQKPTERVSTMGLSNEQLMEIAGVLKIRSDCLRRQVGAIIVKNDEIIATGFNHVSKRCMPCKSAGCLRQQLGIKSGTQMELCRAVHAEMDAILKVNESLKGATLYTTSKPCGNCMKIINEKGIDTIYFVEDYEDRIADEIIKFTGITVIKL